MPTPQSYENHVRWDPTWHFIIMPLLMLNIFFASYETFRHFKEQHHPWLPWWIVMSIVLFLAGAKIRTYSITVQDRVIRLEERLRFAALLPKEELARTESLSKGQIIALRFASDDELPALVKRTLDEDLKPAQIKQAINSWKPDYLRV